MMDDLRDRYDLMQRLNNRPKSIKQVEDEEQMEYLKKWAEEHDSLTEKWQFATIVLFALCITLGTTIFVKSCQSNPEPVAAKKQCMDCHNRQMVMSQYFKKNGSKTPDEMANAILQTKSPKLLASIAVIESNGNHTVRKTGYKKRHDGAFQVNAKHWGEVPRDAVGQALQAESILNELTDTMPIKKALAVYGGDSTDKYSRKILAELNRVP